MRILVTGSREWDDWQLVSTALIGATLGTDWRKVTLVHGSCPSGLDYIADQLARSMGMTPEPHPADWDRHGKAAGPIRNQEMTDAGADICLAFYKKGAANRGTRDCAAKAVRAGIPVKRFEGGTREPSGDSPDSPPAGRAGLPGGSDDYLPPESAGDGAGTWPVLPEGCEVAGVIDYPVIVFGPGGTAYVEPISEYVGKREAKAPS
jgi:hypothetical protein